MMSILCVYAWKEFMSEKEPTIEEQKVTNEFSIAFFSMILKLIMFLGILFVFSFLLFSGDPDLLDGLKHFFNTYQSQRC